MVNKKFLAPWGRSGIYGCNIIYVKWNSEAICKKIYEFSSKIRKDRGLQSWLLWVLEKKLLKSSIIIRIHQIYYRISCTKNQGFENLVVFFEWSTLKSSIFANFWWKSIYFFINRFRIWFDINNVAVAKPKNGPRSRKSKNYYSVRVVIHTSTRMVYQFREAVHVLPRVMGDDGTTWYRPLEAARWVVPLSLRISGSEYPVIWGGPHRYYSLRRTVLEYVLTDTTTHQMKPEDF